jgi:hypothetical protein
MSDFNDIWVPTVAAKEGSLFIAELISCKVFKRLGDVPTSELMARSTYEVLAICVSFDIGVAVGHLGIPVKVGESIFAFV